MTKSKHDSEMDEKFELLHLISINNLSENRLYDLLKIFGSASNIISASYEELRHSVGTDIARQITQFSVDDTVRKKSELLERLAVKIVPFYAEDYPVWLKNTDHFPPVLFIRGSILPEDEISIAVIGTRGATVYGKESVRRFAGDFARAGVTVISGMARGIDTEAHLVLMCVILQRI